MPSRMASSVSDEIQRRRQGCLHPRKRYRWRNSISPSREASVAAMIVSHASNTLAITFSWSTALMSGFHPVSVFIFFTVR